MQLSCETTEDDSKIYMSSLHSKQPVSIFLDFTYWQTKQAPCTHYLSQTTYETNVQNY